NFHHFESVPQGDWATVTESGLEIAIERDPGHQCAVPIPMRAVTDTPCGVDRMLVARIEAWRDQWVCHRRATVQQADCRCHGRRWCDPAGEICSPVCLFDRPHFEEKRWRVLCQPQFRYRIRVLNQPFHRCHISEREDDVALRKADRVRLRRYVQSIGYRLEGFQSTVAQPYLPPSRDRGSREQRLVVGKERPRCRELHVVNTRDQCLILRLAGFGVLVPIGLDPLVEKVRSPFWYEHGG